MSLELSLYRCHIGRYLRIPDRVMHLTFCLASPQRIKGWSFPLSVGRRGGQGVRLILLCVVLNTAACIIVHIGQKCNQQEGPLTELVFTAFDLQGYVQEALPALKAAVYRGDLSQAKDVLALHDEPLYEEYDISQVLLEEDYSWI